MSHLLTVSNKDQIVQMQTNRLPEKGGRGWPESIKRHCREGSDVLIMDYSLKLHDRCLTIEADLKAENVSVNFWQDGSRAWFLALPLFVLSARRA